MLLCVSAGAKAFVLAAGLFTLSWEHSVEKTRWEEDWRATPRGLQLVEARVEGSGAGMEPPEGARLIEGWWVYRPDLPVQQRLVLAMSGATGSGWQICAQGECVTLGEQAGEPAAISVCRR